MNLLKKLLAVFYCSREYSKIINPFHLKFLDNEIESKYKQNSAKKILPMFRLVTILQIIMNTAQVFKGVGQESTHNTMFWLQVVFILIQIIILITHCYELKFITSPNCMSTISYLNSIFSIIVKYYYIQGHLIPNQEHKSYIIQMFNTGINTENTLIAQIIATPSWFVQLLIISSCQLLILGLLDVLGTTNFWTFYILIVLVMILFRYQEYNIRMDFYQIQKQHQNLNQLKNIFDKTIPNSVIVLTQSQQSSETLLGHLTARMDTSIDDRYCIRGLQVLYHNNTSLKQLEAIDQYSILENLKKIIIQSETEQQTSIYELITQEIQNQLAESPLLSDDYALHQNSTQQHICILEHQLKDSIDMQRRFSTETYFDVRLVSCQWDKKPSVVLVINDISEQITLKNLKELDNYKDRLLATVSHDLKTPLNGMVLATHLMQSIVDRQQLITQTEQSELSKYLESFNSSSLLLLYMINDLLDYSQINKGTLRLTPSLFQIESTFKSLQSILGKQAESKKIQLIFESEIPQHSTIQNDENRLKQILINLIGNSLKFTHQGYIKIKASMIKEERQLINISVEDTGCGVHPDIQCHLFKLYSTFNFKNNNQHGVGLGLTITKQLVSMLGPYQTLALTSEVNKGSIFEFKIYRSLEDDCELLSPKQMIPTFQSNMRIRSFPSLDFILSNILIVDDTPINVIALGALIRKVIQDCIILKAENGVEALEVIKQSKIDIVFMDVNMPLMDGYECTRRITDLQQRKLIAPFPIVIVSAFTNEQDKIMSKNSGASYHLDKPVSKAQITQVLSSFGIIHAQASIKFK